MTTKCRLSHKKTIESLQDRVAYLESLLRKHGIEIPPDASSKSTSKVRSPDMSGNTIDNERNERDCDDISNRFASVPGLDLSAYNVDLTDAMQFSDSVEALFTEHGNLDIQPITSVSTGVFQSPSIAPLPSMPSGRNKASSHQHFVDAKASWNSMSNIQNHAENQGLQIKTPVSSSTSFRAPGFTDSSWEENDDEEIMDQLADRIGAFQIAEDGQLRYFGATSNLHILHTGLSSLSRVFSRSVRTEGEEVLSRAGLERKISEDLERHLEDLYFRWEDPSIHVVDEEMYFLAKQEYCSGRDGNPFYSETLKNAICAIGASFTTREDLGPASDAAMFFSSRAKLLLEIEMDSPSVATVQALVIMSATEAAFTRDARGWLYSGMAVRLSIDLGLHLDLGKDGQNNFLTSRELEVRRTAFWGVFVHDNMWSLYVGRPCGISIADVNIARPNADSDKSRYKMWPKILEVYASQARSGQEDPKLYDPIETCASANIELCLMMRQLTQTLYSDQKLPDEKLRYFAAGMRVNFDKWYHQLPSELMVNTADEDNFYLPHVLQLHMQFHVLSVLLHRPFFSRSLNQQDSPSQQDPTNPRECCITATKSIIKLLRMYRKLHTLRRVNVHMVHLVFTASLMCIYSAYSHRGSTSATSLQDLQFCCQALGEIGQAHQNATRALEVVICIKREWFSKTQNFSRSKRPTSATEEGFSGDERRKRRLTQSQGDTEHRVSGGIDFQYETAVFTLGDETSERADRWSFENVGEGPQLSPERFLDEGFELGSDYALIDAANGSFP
ncbi:hypothetical protein BP6252_05000 [Coleophoma cylindrospora]|uniref:Xylanolytic transcriptional activator regulatory domain-containing protein n=1 Tax=Coleophoma cylindrospora TaxID=1849047 RepID=A0A3D8RS92_9HELO|nr:hypothetical protein BP6252_05000 [Coleophoma cylindrospora]